MSSYENCYEILSDVRQGLNEYSTGLLQGTDTSGQHLNGFLVKMINKAVRHIYGILFRRIPGEFLEEADLIGVSSVFTLPWDFGRLLYFKDENGNQVFQTDPKSLKLANETGSKRMYYRKGNTLVLDRDGVTDTYTLLYYRKPRDLDQGKSTAGGTKSITLANTSKAIADYYNGMLIENVTDSLIDTISDYSAARVATLSTNDGAVDKYYGIVPDIPEMFHHLIAPKAIHLVKLESPVAQEKVSKASLDGWTDLLVEALQSYTGSDDGDIEDLFCDYDQTMGALLW